MNWVKKKKGMLAAMILMALGVTSPLAAQNYYESCGVLTEGANCVLFAPQYEPGVRVGLDNTGPFAPGDSVCVWGTTDNFCDTLCPDADYCLADNGISLLSDTLAYYAVTGVLFQDDVCLLFAPYGDFVNPIKLDNYGQFMAGDTVYVSGFLQYGCFTECTGTNKCIVDNSILPGTLDSITFSACGVIVDYFGCPLFAYQGDSGTLFEVDLPQNVVVGDTVCVSGVLDLGCQTDCSDVLGCVVNAQVTEQWIPNVPIPGAAVVEFVADVDIDTVYLGDSTVVVDSLPGEHTYLLAFPDSIPHDQFLDNAALNPGIRAVEPNFEMNFPESQQMSISFPDESAPSHEFNVSPEAFYDNAVNTELGRDSAHELTTGLGVVVAVIDNGVRFDHPLLENAFYSQGYDFYDDDSDASDDSGEIYGHGTFVCGLINLLAPGCQIIPPRAFNGDGIGNSFAVAKSINYAVANGADVINMSFGQYEESFVIREACSTAVAAGVTVVAAGGNDATFMPIFPAAYNKVIGVGSVDTLEVYSSFSNYGSYIDLVAPGEMVYSALAGEFEWGRWSGSSFSSAYVSGACALVLGVEPGLTPSQMEGHLRNTAKTELLWGTIDPPDPQYGCGLLDAAEATWNLEFTPLEGDINGDGEINTGDVIFLINYIFKAGEEPPHMPSADANCDGGVNVGDSVYLIEFIFKGGQAPGCGE